MEFLDLPRIEPSPRARTVAASLFPRRADPRGSIGLAEAEMLLTLIERVDARKVVEIGVASGASTLFILGMLSALTGQRQLFAFDFQAQYFADRSKPSGFLALESEFNRDDRLVLCVEASSLELRSTLAARAVDPGTPVDLAFVDANHRHPWPTIDFLMLLPLMREGGMVVFHDINLPTLTGAARDLGATRLFSRRFPERFVVLGDRPNMGAIRLGDRTEMMDLALASLGEPWEVELSPAHKARVMSETLAGGLADRVADLARNLFSPPA